MHVDTHLLLSQEKRYKNLYSDKRISWGHHHNLTYEELIDQVLDKDEWLNVRQHSGKVKGKSMFLQR